LQANPGRTEKYCGTAWPQPESAARAANAEASALIRIMLFPLSA